MRPGLFQPTRFCSPQRTETDDPNRWMSSCAASCCTCSPKASSAFAISASSPIGGAPRFCRFADKRSARCSQCKLKRKHRLLSSPTGFGPVPSAVGQGSSSRGLHRLRSSSVRPLSLRSYHMKLPLQAPSLGVPQSPAGIVCPSCLRASYPFRTSAQNPAPITRKLQPNQLSLCCSSSTSPSRGLSSQFPGH